MLPEATSSRKSGIHTRRGAKTRQSTPIASTLPSNKGKSFDISTNVEKIGDNAYKITEKINNFGSSQVKTTYVKILKEGVYIIGDSDTKDIFEGIFKN